MTSAPPPCPTSRISFSLCSSVRPPCYLSVCLSPSLCVTYRLTVAQCLQGLFCSVSRTGSSGRGACRGWLFRYVVNILPGHVYMFNRKLFWQLSIDGNLHGLGMLHARTASPKPSFRTPWRVGDAVVSRGNAGWTTSKNGHPCPCQNCSRGPPAEKTGRGSLLNRPSCPPDDPIGQGTEQNRTS